MRGGSPHVRKCEETWPETRHNCAWRSRNCRSCCAARVKPVPQHDRLKTELATNITTAQEGCFPFHGTIKRPACAGGIFPVSELCGSEGKPQPAGPWLPSVLYTVDSDVKRRWHPGLVQYRHRDFIVIGVPIVKRAKPLSIS